jgi:hypothetical protein
VLAERRFVEASELGAAVNGDAIAVYRPGLRRNKERDDRSHIGRVPIHLRLCVPMTTARPCSAFVKFDMSVSITPGATALTRIPAGQTQRRNT